MLGDGGGLTHPVVHCGTVVCVAGSPGWRWGSDLRQLDGDARRSTPEGAAEADADGQKVYQIPQAGWEGLSRWCRMAPLQTGPSGVPHPSAVPEHRANQAACAGGRQIQERVT